jgi:E3 ubiquitin-protein ligase HUWE1
MICVKRLSTSMSEISVLLELSIPQFANKLRIPDTLPPDIRTEILQQECAEQARRHVEDANQAGNVVAPAKIDNADFIASLDPQLREVVLLDQDDGFIQTLPSHMIAEAQGYWEGSHRHHHHRTNIPLACGPMTITHPLYVPHNAIQLLDKVGIAILV